MPSEPYVTCPACGRPRPSDRVFKSSGKCRDKAACDRAAGRDPKETADDRRAAREAAAALYR